MAESPHYEAVLQIYKNQENGFLEKNEQLEEYMAKYKLAMENLDKVRCNLEKDKSKLNENKIKFTKELMTIVSTQQKGIVYRDTVKKRHDKANLSLNQASQVVDNQCDIVREVVQDMKNMDTELQADNVAQNKKDYDGKLKFSKIQLDKTEEDYQKSLEYKPSNSYELSPEVKVVLSRKVYKKSLNEVDADITRVKNNLAKLNAKINEHEE